MGTEAELGQALSWTEPVAQTFWTLAYPLGLMKTRLRFFHSRRNREETLGTWSQSFISTPINLTATLHPLVRVARETLFSRLCGRAPFPSDTVSGLSWTVGHQTGASEPCLGACTLGLSVQSQPPRKPSFPVISSRPQWSHLCLCEPPSAFTSRDMELPHPPPLL